MAKTQTAQAAAEATKGAAAPAVPEARIAPKGVDVAAAMQEIRQSANDFAEADLMSDSAVTHIKHILGVKGVSFKYWESCRQVWQNTYANKRTCNDEAAGKAWQRLIKETGLSKPKSESAESTKKAGQLAAHKAAVDSLVKQKPEALTARRAELAVKVADGDQAAVKEIGQINAALKQKEDAVQAAAKKALAESRDRVRKLVADCTSLEALAQVERILVAAAQPALSAALTKPGAVGEAMIAAEKKTQAKGKRAA